MAACCPKDCIPPGQSSTQVLVPRSANQKWSNCAREERQVQRLGDTIFHRSFDSFDDFCYFSSIIEGRQRSHHITPWFFVFLGHHGMNKGNGIVPSPSVGICGMLGIPWPQQHQQHAAPEEPYGLGSQRTLADYEGPHGSHGMPIFCQMKKQHVATFENPLPIIGPLVWRIVLHVSTCFKFFTMHEIPENTCLLQASPASASPAAAFSHAPGWVGSQSTSSRRSGRTNNATLGPWLWPRAIKGHRMGKMGPEWEKTWGNSGFPNDKL